MGYNITFKKETIIKGVEQSILFLIKKPIEINSTGF